MPAQITIDELKEQYFDVISRPNLSEEQLHQFLVQFPVFLPILWPLQNTIFSKLSLGNQHRTDFAFARENTPGITWHLIEIEKPRDRLFTRAGNPSAKLSHAIRQLHDWNTWFIENRSFLERHLPFSAEMKRFGLWKPELLLVMGRRSEVSEDDKRLMQRMSEDSMQIMTFDRLADRIALPLLDDLNQPLRVCAQQGGSQSVLSEMRIHITYELTTLPRRKVIE